MNDQVIDPNAPEVDAGEDEGRTFRVVNLLFSSWTIGRFTFAKNIMTLHSESDVEEFGELMSGQPEYIRGNVVVTEEKPGEQPMHVMLGEIAAKRRQESAQAAGASGVKIEQKSLDKGGADVLPRNLLMPQTQQSSVIRGASTATDAGPVDKPRV